MILGVGVCAIMVVNLISDVLTQSPLFHSVPFLFLDICEMTVGALSKILSTLYEHCSLYCSDQYAFFLVIAMNWNNTILITIKKH